jgi:guanine deaminase
VLIRASLLSAPSLQELRFEADGGLVVDGKGSITDAGAFEAVSARHPGMVVEDLRPFWILPGLVDLHAHLPQYEAVAADGLELLPWLERHIFPAEARFADGAHARATARTYLRDALSLGTTTTVLYATIHAEATDAIFQEAEACGIRAVIGKTMMDRHAPGSLREDTETSLRDSEELCRAWHGRDGGRLQYAFTPRFAPSCSRELMLGAGRLAQKYGAFIQTHLAENLQELEWVRELFPEADSYTDVYRRFGLLGSRTLLGHGIHLAPAERRVLRESGSHLIHCPSSNAFLQSGIMPLRKWLGEGLSVGLGTDVGAGPSLSMFREMGEACTASKLRRAAQTVQTARLSQVPGLSEEQKLLVAGALDLDPQPALDAVGAFHLATRGGAEALGLGDRLGRLEPGFDADFLVVDIRQADPLKRVSADPAHVLSRLVYRSDPHLVQAAYVRGRRCFHRSGT